MKDIASKLAWAGVFAGVGLVADYVFLQRGQWTSILGVTAFLLLVVVVMLSGARRELSDFVTGTVQVETGAVTKLTRSYGTGRYNRLHYFYQINGTDLEVSQFAYNALLEGAYTVCYLPKTHGLVNIEPVVSAFTGAQGGHP